MQTAPKTVKPIQSPSPPRRARSRFVGRWRSIGQLVNTWLQVVAIVLAGFWAIGIFYFDNVVAPRRRPAHVNVQLDLAKAGTKDGNLAIQLSINAENSSARKIYMLPAIYRVWAIRNAGNALDEAEFQKIAKEKIRQRKDDMVGRYSPEAERTLIAVGRVFTDWHLDPGERVLRTAVIQVPQGGYDSLLSTFSVPVSHQERGLSMEWDPVAIESSKLYYNPGDASKGRGAPVDWEDPGFRDRTGFAFATARAVLSLWETGPE